MDFLYKILHEKCRVKELSNGLILTTLLLARLIVVLIYSLKKCKLFTKEKMRESLNFPRTLAFTLITSGASF